MSLIMIRGCANASCCCLFKTSFSHRQCGGEGADGSPRLSFSHVSFSNISHLFLIIGFIIGRFSCFAAQRVFPFKCR